MEKAIKIVTECHKVCLETINHCMTMGGEHASPDHIKLLMDCAKICDTSVDFMVRKSEFHPETCGVCADICEACAESCDKLDGKEMKRCAEACRACAEICREMSLNS